MASIFQTIQKIDGFSTLSKGWHYGSGEAINVRLRQRAIDLIRIAERHGISRTDAFPGENGEIALSLYRGKETFAITLEPDDTFHIIKDIDNEIVNEFYEIDELEARLKLWEFSHRSQSMSTSSISLSGNLSAIDSVMLLLSVLQNLQIQKEGYQQFQQNVLEVKRDLFVTTSPFTTIRI